MDSLSSFHKFVPETKFGKWFLRSKTWSEQVLDVALADLERLMSTEKKRFETVVDVGCGYGHSLIKLKKAFSPQQLIGIDIDPEMIKASSRKAQQDKLSAGLICCSNSNIPFASNSIDILFCHQTFHHLVDQQAAIKEYFRILKPGGQLLFAESTRRYIHSWIIKLLFRHPMEVQKTAGEYITMIRGSGFKIEDKSIAYPYLWWSREDLGIAENWFGIQPKENREETLVNLIAIKPENKLN